MKQGLVKYGCTLALALLLPALGFADAADQWVAYAAKQYAARQYDAAITSYSSAAKANPRSAAAYQGLGNCYMGKGDKTNALKYYQYALQLNPANTSLANYVASLGASSASAPAGGETQKYFQYGNQYMAAKQYDYAISYYNKALAADPSDPKVNQAIGTAYYYKGQKDQALAYFDKALASDPTNSSLRAYADKLRGSSATAAEASDTKSSGSVVPYVMGTILFAAATAMIFLF